MTCNGQAPFVTMFMYLDEVPEGQTRDDLATLIEEVLKQRIQGVKNEKGVWITPAFPKIIYVLDEDNVTPDSKYWKLTELAAKDVYKRQFCAKCKNMFKSKSPWYGSRTKSVGNYVCSDCNEQDTNILRGVKFIRSKYTPCSMRNCNEGKSGLLLSLYWGSPGHAANCKF